MALRDQRLRPRRTKKPIAKVQPYNFQQGTGANAKKVEGSIVQVIGGYLGDGGKVVAYVQTARLFEGNNRAVNAAAFARQHGYRVVT